MSSFNCETCHAMCTDTECGYVTGCEHYPVEEKPLRVWIMRKMNESLAQLGYIERVAITNRMPPNMFDALEKARKAIREVHEVAFRFQMPTSTDSQTAKVHAQQPGR